MRQPPSVDAYGAGGFRIGDERIDGSVLILQDRARPWAASSLAALEPADFRDVVGAGSAAVELVLLGTGAATAMAPRPVREALRAAGLGLEVMNTPEACRLYNFLAQEGRRVAAALLAV